MTARSWALFAAVSVLWGIPYLFIKLADDGGMPPLVLAWGRIVLGAIVLLALAGRAGVLRQCRGRARGILLYAIAEVVVPFPLIAAGERDVPSSIAAIVVAAVPLLVAVLALWLDPTERASGARLVGLLVGFVGVVLLVGVEASGSTRSLLGSFAVLVAALGYACGSLLLGRQLTGVDPRAAMGASLAVAAVVLTPLAILDWPSRAPSAGAFGALAVLGFVCTAAAFVLMAMLIAAIGSGRAVVITYLNPVVAVALGVAVLGERPAGGAIGGLVLILAGSWVSTGGRLPGARRRAGREAERSTGIT